MIEVSGIVMANARDTAESQELFRERLSEIFLTEAGERLTELSDGLLQLRDCSADAEYSFLLESVHRAAHSLKGAARAVGDTQVESASGDLESAFLRARRAGDRFYREELDSLHQAVGALRSMIRGGLG